MGIFSELGRRVGKFEKRARSAREDAVGEANWHCEDCGAEFEDKTACPDCGSTAVRKANEAADE